MRGVVCACIWSMNTKREPFKTFRLPLSLFLCDHFCGTPDFAVFRPFVVPGGERLCDVGDDVPRVFDADRQADQVGRYACGRQLLVGELAVRVARGMKYRSACVGYVRDDRAQFERVHEADQ